MPVELSNDQRLVALDLNRIRKTAQALLEGVGRGEAILSVLLIGDRQMARIHRKWMGDPNPTDVISFPQQEILRGRAPRGRAAPVVLGDIVISVETARRIAPQDVMGEIARYLIHGLLHLVGYDHGKEPDRRRMERQASRLIKTVSPFLP